jgi:hypothetical protein
MAGRVLHLEGFEGKAVAVDQDTDEVVAAAETLKNCCESFVSAVNATR